jgi:hypothetical protein
VKWFGESWGAPVCHPLDHAETPVDSQCIFCPRSILEDDDGFLLPHYTGEGEVVTVAAHRECFVRSILPRYVEP